MLVVVDQFEEVFRFRQTSSANEDAAAAFVNLLLEASQQKDVPVYVILTMRSDYIGDCAEFRGLAEAVNEGEYLIPRLGRDQLRRAIEGPVKVGGGQIANRLVQELLNDVGNNQDQLPVLQHALMRTWDDWESHHAENEPLDLRHYESVGGMEAALSRHADETCDELADDRHRLVAEKIFKALTERGPDNRGIRRPTRLERLCAIVDGTEEEVTTVLDAFRKQGRTFLMPMQSVELTPQSVIDISHESLMRVWKRLSHWVEEESQSARVYRRLAETAALHAEGKAGVYHDPDLQIALAWRESACPNQAWAERYHGGFEQALEFLDASGAAKRAEEEARETARRRELEQAKKLAETEQRAARRLRGMVAGLAIVALVAMIASIVALVARRDAQLHARDAERQREIASRNATEAKDQAELANQNAAIAQQQAQRADQNAATAQQESARADREAKRAVTQAELAVQARGDARRSLYFANINMAQRSLEALGGVGRAQQLLGSWRPIGDETDLRGWEWYYLDSFLGGATQVLRGHDTAVNSIRYSPDGTRLASAGDGDIKVWDVKTGRNLVTLVGHVGYIPMIAWSPDGSQLASAGADNTVRLWGVQTGRTIRVIRENESSVTCVAWSPDGSKLATTSVDGAARIFDAVSGERLRTFEGHSGRAGSVSWSPDGSRLVTSDTGGWVRIWNAQTAEAIHAQRGHQDEVWCVAWSPDATRIASASDDTTIKIWDAGTGEQVRSWSTGIVFSIAWSPDGDQLASGNIDRTVRVWNWRTGQETKRLDSGELIRAVAWSPDGALLAGSGGVNRRIAVAGAEYGVIRLWNTRTWEEVQALRGHQQVVRSVSWHHDGTRLRLASASPDATAKVWDGQTGLELLTVSERQGQLFTVGWSPDGTRLATAGADGSIKVRDATPGYRRERSPILLAQLDDRVQQGTATIDDLRLRAEIYARLGRWDEAAAPDLSRVMELVPKAPFDHESHWSAYHLGAVLIETGDMKAYDRYRRKLLDRHEGTQNADWYERTSRVVLQPVRKTVPLPMFNRRSRALTGAAAR